MTFYRLWSGKPLKKPGSRRTYIAADLDFFIDVSKDIGIDTDLENVKEEILNKKPEERSDEARRITAAVLIGDAEWNEPLEDWLRFPLNRTIRISDSGVHHLWMKNAREVGDTSNLDFPEYNTPATLDIPLEKLSYIEQALLAGLITDLEWYAYIAEETDADIDSELIDRTRRETINYFTENEDLSEDVAEFQSALAIRASDWMDDVMNDFNFRSMLITYFSKKMRKLGEEKFS